MLYSLPNLYIGTGGGLGDVIRNYLKDDLNWGRLADIKKKNPHVDIRALFCCHNDGVVELFRHHPFISLAQNFPYEHHPWPVLERYANGYKHIREIQTSCFQYQQPTVYLSQEEHNILRTIQDLGPYIAVHAFAGDLNRIALQPINYLPVLEKIYYEFGLRSVLIGKSGDRCLTGNSIYMTELITEESYPWLTNMLNVSNPRLDIKIIESETAFIGTHSCYILPSWIYQKPSVLVAPGWLHTNLTTREDCSWATKHNMHFSRVVYTDVPYPRVPDMYTNVDVKKAQAEIFNMISVFFKKA